MRVSLRSGGRKTEDKSLPLLDQGATLMRDVRFQPIVRGATRRRSREGGTDKRRPIQHARRLRFRGRHRQHLVAYVRMKNSSTKTPRQIPTAASDTERLSFEVSRVGRARRWVGPLTSFSTPMLRSNRAGSTSSGLRDDRTRTRFDSGSNVEGLVRPLEQGQAKVRTGPCVDVQNPPANRCVDSYSVEALMRMFGGALR